MSHPENERKWSGKDYWCWNFGNLSVAMLENSYLKLWVPFQLKQRMTHTLPHHETERQWSVNHIWFCILGNEGFVSIGALIAELLSASKGKNTTDRRQNAYSK